MRQQILNGCDSDRNLTVNSSESDLFDLDGDDGNYDSNTSTASAMKKHFETHIQEKMQKVVIKKMKICKLDSISIPPSSTDNVQHILNLKQEFSFPTFGKNQKDNSVQTLNQISFRQKTPYPNANSKSFVHQEQDERPQSVPIAAMSSHRVNIPRVTADVKPELIGDCVENNLKKIKQIECDLRRTDLELTGTFPNFQNPVQCVLIKPR